MLQESCCLSSTRPVGWRGNETAAIGKTRLMEGNAEQEIDCLTGRTEDGGRRHEARGRGKGEVGQSIMEE